MNNLKITNVLSVLVFVCLVFAFSVNLVKATEITDNKKQLQKEKVFYKDSKKELIKERKKVKNATKEQIKKNAKERLVKIIDRLLFRLSKIETWVNNRNSLSDTQKSTILAEIAEDKNWLNAKKGKVQNASPGEIRKHAKEVRTYWKNNRSDIKKIVGQVLASRVEFAINKLETASEKLNSAIIKAQANGKDVTKAKKLLDELNSKIKLAKSEAKEAQNAFNNISSIKDADNFFKKGRAHIKKARNYLVESHKIIKNIIKDLRA